LALPCRPGCPIYKEGCHKGCGTFKAKVQEEQERKAKIKAARDKIIDEAMFMKSVMTPVMKITAKKKNARRNWHS